MGVPAFFRWLSRKYPSIIVDAVEEKSPDVDGEKVPVDATKPNPNFQEFDNLYLDMNGIIHPCTHPEDRPAPKTEDEMFILIFEYIDRLFSIVRPRRVLYMAIDGVAPRAKMNQQRSRRFRAAKEAKEKKEEILKVRQKLASEGVPLPPPKAEEEHFDSNCITPGTPFMDRLAVALRYYIHKRISTDPAWQSIQVILSDANVPGEGEHKIMDFIRRQRSSPSHDPNTVHCLCGADADLIMLGLATHEANFNILREEFVPNQPRACELCGQYGHDLKSCTGLANQEAGPDQADPLKKQKNFIFIRLPVLREYLERELQMPNLPFKYDFERAIDDWVFMCFFVGNDFLPHLPSLEIRENAIDRLIKLYKDVVYTTKGWLTNSGDVYLDRVQEIMIELGKAEDEIFKTRQIRELRYRQNNKNSRNQELDGGKYNNYSSPKHNYFNNNNNPSFHRPYERRNQERGGGGQYAGHERFDNRSVHSGGGGGPSSRNRFAPLMSQNLTQPAAYAGHGAPPAPLMQNYQPLGNNSASYRFNDRNRFENNAGHYGYGPPRNRLLPPPLPPPLMAQNFTHTAAAASEYAGYVAPPAPLMQNCGRLSAKLTPQESHIANMSGAETRRLAAQDRIEQMRCAEASVRLRAILLPAGSKRPASPDQSEPRAKSFKETTGTEKSDRNENSAGKNSSSNNAENDEEGEPHDEIRLWESGWKERYYQAKFGISESDADFRHKVAWAYAEGLCWVLKYYYQGCASWNWYFPYHYAPFASDFDTIGQFKPDFSKPTKPFKPLEQLMGVFPAASRAHIPETWRWLMTDEESPIFDFYPNDFDIDLNGKKFAWQGVALLPFVDERRLLSALNDVYQKLTDEEKRRNETGPDRLFIGQQHPLFSSLLEVYNSGKAIEFEETRDKNDAVVREWVYIDQTAANGMSGEVSWDKDAVKPHDSYPSLFRNSIEFNDVQKNTCIMVIYRDPQYSSGYVFQATRLENAKELERVLKPGDWDERRNGKFQPQIGFTRDIAQAHLSKVGHRILNHSMHPPNQYQQGQGRNGQRNHYKHN